MAQPSFSASYSGSFALPEGGTVSAASEEFPGTAVPSRERDPEAYERYWRALALWAYKWGPVFLDILKED
jgi:hypothetical protein